ncbi:MAG: hypothetical protein OJF52_002800 [Nitrospira sp.]|nr:MAG: hypothetical protein OJF52_002800 [Nitrospira sp.]
MHHTFAGRQCPLPAGDDFLPYPSHSRNRNIPLISILFI